MNQSIPVDDRKATEKFVSKILPPFARKTPTVETLIAALYLAGVSSLYKLSQ